MNTWMDRYIYAVGRKLPKKMRADIERELKSNLLDALEEKTNGREPTEQDVLELLNEFGDPDKVAAEYMPGNKYVIGPELYDLYKFIIGIASIAITIGLTVALMVSVVMKDVMWLNPLQNIAQFFGSLFSAIVSMVGTVTLVFLLIQFSLRSQRAGVSDNVSDSIRKAEKELKFVTLKKNPTKKTWSSEQLAEVPKSIDQVRLSESVAAMIFIVIALVVFNFYPEKIGVNFYDSAASTWVSYPIFNIGILRGYLVFFNLIWAAELLLHLRLIQRGRWGLVERFSKIAVSLFGLGVFLAFIQNSAVLNTSVMTIGFEKLGTDLAPLLKWAAMNAKILVIIVIIGTIIEVIKQLVYAVKSKL